MEDTKTTDATAEQAETPDKEQRKHRRGMIIAIIIAVCLIVAGLGGWGGYRAYAAHQLEVAQASCRTALTDARKARNDYEATLKGMKVVAALKVTDADVADKTTVTDLKAATSKAMPRLASCKADDKAAMDKNTTGLKTTTTAYAKQSGKMTQAADKVMKSQAAKQLADAKQALQQSLDAAKNKLNESNGKVQDNATRDALQKAIDAASKDTKDVKMANDLKSQLDNAVNAVNDSMKAKSDADAAAAAQAAAAQAAAAQAAQAQAQRSYTPSRSYSTPAAPQSSGGVKIGGHAYGTDGTKPVISHPDF